MIKVAADKHVNLEAHAGISSTPGLGRYRFLLVQMFSYQEQVVFLARAFREGRVVTLILCG